MKKEQKHQVVEELTARLQAAETLFIHRSTLKYRLGRIASLTGVDLADPDARFNLQLATRTLATIRALAMGSAESGPERGV